jgi:CubicO group peptidase (beta-lactamase class C family)
MPEPLGHPFEGLRPLRVILLLASLSGWVHGVQAQLPRGRPELVGMSSERLARIPGALRGFVEHGNVAGVVTLVARRGRVVALDSAGFRDVARRSPMRSNTIFRIASMTKPVTSVAAMILVEEGKLRLNDPVSKFLPEFAESRVAVMGPGTNGNQDSVVKAERPIRVRDLLTHRSGLVYAFSDTGRVGNGYRSAGVNDAVDNDPGASEAENVRRLAAQPLAFQPGREWRYGLSTDVLGVLVEAVSGMPLAEFFERRIFAPLRMKDTGFRVPDEKLGRLVTTYTHRNDSLVPMSDSASFADGRVRMGRFGGPSNRGSKTFYSGGAGLFSTIGDYARFAQMLLNGGALDGVGILGPKTIELMTADATSDLRAPLGSAGWGFGLGFGILRNLGDNTELASVGQYGWGGIFGTSFWVDPREQLIGVMMIQQFPEENGLAEVFQNLAYQAITVAGRP